MSINWSSKMECAKVYLLLAYEARARVNSCRAIGGRSSQRGSGIPRVGDLRSPARTSRQSRRLTSSACDCQSSKYRACTSICGKRIRVSRFDSAPQSKVFEPLCCAAAPGRAWHTAHLITEARSLVRGALLAASRLLSQFRASGPCLPCSACTIGGAGGAQEAPSLPVTTGRCPVLIRVAPIFEGRACSASMEVPS